MIITSREAPQTRDVEEVPEMTNGLEPVNLHRTSNTDLEGAGTGSIVAETEKASVLPAPPGA